MSGLHCGMQDLHLFQHVESLAWHFNPQLWHMGSSSPTRGRTPGPLHWERGVLANISSWILEIWASQTLQGDTPQGAADNSQGNSDTCWTLCKLLAWRQFSFNLGLYLQWHYIPCHISPKLGFGHCQEKKPKSMQHRKWGWQCSLQVQGLIGCAMPMRSNLIVTHCGYLRMNYKYYFCFQLMSIIFFFFEQLLNREDINIKFFWTEILNKHNC